MTFLFKAASSMEFINNNEIKKPLQNELNFKFVLGLLCLIHQNLFYTFFNEFIIIDIHI